MTGLLISIFLGVFGGYRFYKKGYLSLSVFREKNQTLL